MSNIQKSKKVLQTIQKNISEDEKKKWKIYLEISWRHFVIMNCRELITFLETEVPLETAEGWDNPGFLVGDKDKEIKKVLVVLDITNEAVDYAIDQKADFILVTSSDHFFKDQQMLRVMISFRSKLLKTDPPRYMCIWNAYMLRCLQNGRSSSRSLEFEGNTGTS